MFADAPTRWQFVGRRTQCPAKELQDRQSDSKTKLAGTNRRGAVVSDAAAEFRNARTVLSERPPNKPVQQFAIAPNIKGRSNRTSAGGFTPPRATAKIDLEYGGGPFHFFTIRIKAVKECRRTG
jgi:hypothetical protein